jgi:hypothetical protein
MNEETLDGGHRDTMTCETSNTQVGENCRFLSIRVDVVRLIEYGPKARSPFSILFLNAEMYP